ncbi:MAG: OmpA family protein [Pseudomonadota bacterium]
MTEAARDFNDVTRLKSLLFRNEQEAIAELRGQIDAHHDRIGSDVVLQRSVSEVIAGALRDARVRQHQQVADAIAPLLVEGMKREIRNSRDEMVDALYPILGRLVSAYVASAVNDVMRQTNRRLEAGLTGRFLLLRIKALLTGQSYAALALADQSMYRMSELMLIRRGSGVLIDHLKLEAVAEARASATEQDSALVSGMVAAIHEFAQEAFAKRHSALRSVDMGDQTIYLRATAGLILAVVGQGRARRKFERTIDRELISLLEERSKDIALLEDDAAGTSPKLLPVVAERLTAVQTEMSQKRPILAMILFGLIGAAVAAGIGWLSYTSWDRARLYATAQETIASERGFEGYPVQIDVSDDRQLVRVAGFAPSDEAGRKATAALQRRLGDGRVSAKFKVVATGESDDTRLRAAETALAAVTGRVGSTEDRVSAAAEREALRALGSEVSALERRSAEARRTFAERTDRLRQRIAALETRKVGGPGLDPLTAFVMRNGIFFQNGTRFREEAIAKRTLDRLAALLRETDTRLRVIGYADLRGRADSNRGLATNRAEAVVAALVSRGIAENRLIIAERSAERMLSTVDGPEGGNRRVEFELPLTGE